MKNLTLYTIPQNEKLMTMINRCSGSVLADLDENVTLDLKNNEIACRALSNKASESGTGIRMHFSNTEDFQVFYRYMMESALIA